MNEAQQRTMDLAYLSWQAQLEAAERVHKAIAEYASLVYDEWHDLRGCTPEAAYGVARDRLEVLAKQGIQDHLNRLYREKNI